MALFVLLKTLAKSLSISEIGIAHVNHSLRGQESDADEAFVLRLAENAGVACHAMVVQKHDVPQSGIEEWARNTRYGFFSRVVQEHGYDFIATAHTANDQAETVLMRIVRGCGILGLSAIERVRKDRIIRPLIDVEKIALLNWLAQNNQDFREDASNADTLFLRNWIRRDIIPKLVKKERHAVKNLCSIAKDAFVLGAIVKEEIDTWVSNYVVKNTAASFIVDKKGFLDNVVWSYAMAGLFREHGILYDRPHIADIRDNSRKNGKLFLLSCGWCYRVTQKTLDFITQPEILPIKQFNQELILNKDHDLPLDLGKLFMEYRTNNPVHAADFSNPNTVFLDANKTGKDLVARSIKEHETFWPFGAKSMMNIDEFLKKQKLTKFDRNHTFVIAQKHGSVVWIAGKRTDERFKVNSETTNILKISWKPDS